ncbi:amino acid ABC transporter substrate-binding protein [Rhodoferax sp. AJA081-3]|uniref:amino acid ABC transporter substrate-binding protein n=1 Tax=Rhodoferax sp. AJA081-3 TaxID=2752316 RepID=UPI0035302719
MLKPTPSSIFGRPSNMVLGAVLLALASAATAGPTLDRIRVTGKVVLGHRESSVPFSYMDADKKPVGYALDLCLKLADAVKKKLDMKTLNVEYVMVTPSNRISLVEEGKVDMECGSTTNNAERRNKVAFTVPHYITGARYMVRANNPATDLVGLENQRVVSTKGTTPLKAIERANRERVLRLTLQEAPDHARAVEMVEKSESDAFIMDDVLLYGLIASRAQPEKLKVIGKFLTVEPLAIMLPKGDPEFKAILDNEMKRLIVSREAHVIYDRWFLKPIPPKNTPLNLPMNYLLRDFWKYPTDQVPGV